METILVVDDEPSIRALLNAALGSYGFQILTAASGEEALTVCEQHQGEIHLLLTDVRMPQMDGRELARRLSAMRPTMKILYMSGFADEMQDIANQLVDGTEFVEKPFSHHMLLGRILLLLKKGHDSGRSRSVPATL